MSFTETVQDIVLVAEETEVFGATPTLSRRSTAGSMQVRQPHARTRFFRALPALYQSVALVMLVVALIAVSLSGAATWWRSRR